VRFHWLLPSLLGVLSTLLLSAPAAAARLQFWRFNPTENRLVFTTDGDVQPRAQLIANPTRLVIDLPGVTLGSAMVNQPVGGGIREVRVGQFDAQTTRIVVELNVGYTLDPQQVQVRGATPTQWTVQLPTPQRVDSASPPIAAPPTYNPPTSNLPTNNPPTNNPSTPPLNPAVTGAATQLESVRVTQDGLFLRTTGASPEIEVDRSRDRRQVSIDLANTAVSPQLTPTEIPVNRNGVERLVITQAQVSPPVARVTLDLSSRDVELQTSVSTLGGIVIVPTGGAVASAEESPAPVATPPAPQQPATIQAVELAGDGSQLVVRADQPLTYTSGWERSSAAYRILIPNARLAPQVTAPQLPAGSSLLRVRLQQQDEQTVAILVQPAAGVQVGEVNQPSNQSLALQLQRGTQVSPSPGQVVPVPPPSRPGISPTPTTPPGSLPTIPNGRVVVVVDPGHGGSDPGAIGIGGLREQEINLSIAQQVAAILEQQGVQAVLTRSDNRDVELEPRVQIAERSDADLFVSIHANAISMSRPDVNGVETYYYSSGERLARTIHNSIMQSTDSADRGVRQARFYVLRNTSMPSVLVEVGFVTGRDDARRLADPAFRSQMAQAIARGILQYVQQNF
jgi:N-acetylmuramoyl-L-alanine amidase